MKSKLMIWIPVAFAAYLCLSRLYNGASADATFYSFLPMCFLLAAFSQLVLIKRVESLEAMVRQQDAAGGGQTERNAPTP